MTRTIPSLQGLGTVMVLGICISLTGCGSSTTGIAYDQLPEPQSPMFAKWEPLPEEESAVTGTSPIPAEDDGQASAAQPAEESSVATPSEDASATEPEAPSGSQIEQASATVEEAAEVMNAVDVRKSLEGNVPAGSPVASAMAKLTPEQRRNLLMNNPDLEEDMEPREPKLLIPEKQFRKEDGGKVTRVSYDDIDLLKVLNMHPVPMDAPDYFPDWLTSLDGKRIRIRGFMIPPFKSEGLTRFLLARDNGICCFVRTPKIYDVIAVRMAEGQATDYIANRPFDVEGIFHIDPYAEDGEWYDLYRIDDATVSE